MPTLSAIQKHDAIKTVPIDFGDGDILTLTLDGNLFTVGFLKRLQALDESDLPAFADMFFSLVTGWDLTDDAGEPLPLDQSTIESLRIETFVAIVKRINESQNPNPETSI